MKFFVIQIKICFNEFLDVNKTLASNLCLLLYSFIIINYSKFYLDFA